MNELKLCLPYMEPNEFQIPMAESNENDPSNEESSFHSRSEKHYLSAHSINQKWKDHATVKFDTSGLPVYYLSKPLSKQHFISTALEYDRRVLENSSLLPISLVVLGLPNFSDFFYFFLFLIVLFCFFVPTQFLSFNLQNFSYL